MKTARHPDVRATSAEAIVAAIFAAVHAPHTWPDVFRAIGDTLGADCGMMMTPAFGGATAVPLFVYGLDMTPVMAAYPRHAGRAEFTHRALATGRAPDVFFMEALFPPEERATNDYWREIIAPLGFHSGLICLARLPEEGGRPVLLNFFRRLPAAPFRERERAILRRLLPTLRAALAVVLDAPQPATVSSGVADLADAARAPCLLVGDRGVVLHANEAARALIAQDVGVRLHGRAIALSDRRAQIDLDRALKRTTTALWSTRIRRGGEILARGPAGHAHVIVVTPLGIENPIAALSSQARSAVYFLEESGAGSDKLVARLRQLYGLTTAEAEIVADIGGATIAEIANARGTSPDTVRSQVKSALAKTGARRQAALAALAHRLR